MLQMGHYSNENVGHWKFYRERHIAFDFSYLVPVEYLP